MGISLSPLPTSTGLVFGTPVTFNTSGTFTIPSTATTNSTIMVETIGGGGGGAIPNGCLAAPVNNYFGAGYNTNEPYGNGSGGNSYLGIWNLGFFSAAPAGQTITVTVGAGGTGSSINATSFTGNNGNATFSFPNQTGGNTGGSSSVTFSGITVATATGGAGQGGTGGGNAQAVNFLDNTTWNAIAPRGGVGVNSFNFTSNTGTYASMTSNGGAGGKPDWYTATNNTFLTSASPNASVTGTTTVAQGTDAPAGTGQGGGPTIAYVGSSSGTVTVARAGNGASPGGGGGGWGWMSAMGVGSTINFTAGQVGGAGGSGRVRIWFQP
jgi:hypothetical protein